MEIHQLRYFRAVAECESFTRAAKREHVSQPSLSHQILKLEDELSAKLFDRTGKAVKLTAAGETFLPTAQSILRQVAEARSQIREIAGIESGRGRVGVIPTVAPFFLPSVLASFAKQYPLIEVSVVEQPGAVLLELLRDRNIDLAIMPVAPGEKGITSTELFQEKLFAVVCEGHALGKYKKIRLEQMGGAPFLFLKDGHCFRDDVLAMFQKANVQPRITFESGCFLTVLNMVKAGIGVSVVPEMAVKRGSGCKFIPIESDQPVRTISLVQLQNGQRTRAQELLADFFTAK
jgi:LysR family hydrogen peroxide-inducible transcriptional activator